jgi:hypothetical protein
MTIKRTEANLTAISNVNCKNVVTVISFKMADLNIAWQPSTQYRITVEEGFVREPDGNRMPLPADDAFLTFDTNPPFIIDSTVPSELYPTFLGQTTSEPVINNTNIFLFFNRNRFTAGQTQENVAPFNSSSAVKLYKEQVGGDVLIYTFLSTDPRIITASVTLGFNLNVTGLMREDSTYYIIVDEGFLIDRDGFISQAFDGRLGTPNRGSFTTADAETYPVLQSDFVPSEAFLEALAGYRRFFVLDFNAETTLASEPRRFRGITEQLPVEFSLQADGFRFRGGIIFQPVSFTLTAGVTILSTGIANLNSNSTVISTVGSIKQFSSTLNSTSVISKATTGFIKNTSSAISATSTLQLLPSDILLFNITTAGLGMQSYRRSGSNWIQDPNNYGTGLIVSSGGSNNFRTYFPRIPNTYRHWSKYDHVSGVASVLRRAGLTFNTVASGTISLENFGGYHAYAGVNRDGNSVASRDSAGLNIYNVSGSNLVLQQPIANTQIVLASWNPANGNELVYNSFFDDTFRLVRRDNFASNFSQRSSTFTDERSSGFLWHPSGDGLFVSYSVLGTPNSSNTIVKYYERTGDTFTQQQAFNWDLNYAHISEIISHWHPSGLYFVSGRHNETDVIKLWSWTKSSGLTLLQTISVDWDTGPYNMAWTSDGNSLVVAGSSPTTPRLYEFQNETLSLVGSMGFLMSYNSPLFIAN